MADIHNVTSDETLKWKTPHSKRKGETPDISAYMQFHFYEKVYYLDPTAVFSDTKELPGYWLGVADNVGDSLCYNILTAHKRTVLERSVVRSAERGDQNKTVTFPTDNYTPNFDIEQDHRESAQDIPQQIEEKPSNGTTQTVLQHEHQRQLGDERRRSTGSPQRANHRPPPILRRSTRHVKQPQVNRYAQHAIPQESSHEQNKPTHVPLHHTAHDAKTAFCKYILDYKGNRKEVRNLDDFDNQTVTDKPSYCLDGLSTKQLDRLHNHVQQCRTNRVDRDDTWEIN